MDVTTNGGAGGGFSPLLLALDAEALLGVVEAGFHSPDVVETRMVSLLAGREGTVMERMVRVFDAHASLHSDDGFDGDARGAGRRLAFLSPLDETELLEPGLDVVVLGLSLDPVSGDVFAGKTVRAVLRHRADMASRLLDGRVRHV